MYFKPNYTLEPYISNEAIDIHFNGHHMQYVNNLINYCKESPKSEQQLEELILNNLEDKIIFNNGCQILNHNLFWRSMKLNCQNNNIKKILDDKINFSANFIKEANSMFGSGWIWLLFNKNTKNFEIKKTFNADCIFPNCEKIINLDLWEHAYYINYQNKRQDFINVFMEKLINWDLIEEKAQLYL